MAKSDPDKKHGRDLLNKIFGWNREEASRLKEYKRKDYPPAERRRRRKRNKRARAARRLNRTR